MNILVVDDEIFICELLEEFLAKLGHGVSTALSGREALKKFSEENQNLKIKGGVMDGRVLDLDAINALSDLPSREILLSQVLSALNAVPTSLVRALSDLPRRLMSVINAIKDQKEAA